MIINIKHVNNIVVLELDGRLTIGSDLALRNAIQHAVNKNSSNLIFSFKGVTTIDSAGVGELVSAYSTLSSKVGNIKLCSLPGKLSDVLHVTKLISVFDIYDTEQDAIDSFNKSGSKLVN